MRLAETVTFGGSGLDRAAQLRSDPESIARMLATGTVLPIWRGKPLCAGDALHWVPSVHPVLANAPAPVLLGLDAGQPRFASDLSAWSPETGVELVQTGFSDPSIQRHPDLGETAGFVELRGIMARLSAREGELAATGKAILGWHSSHGFCAACGSRSNVAQAGWQRVCPACKTQHFPRTDPVVIMLVTHGNRVLLGRNAAWPEGMFSLLAGFMEPGETIEAAVRREVQEETGISCLGVDYLASQPWPFPASLMIAATTEAATTAITLDPVELEAARWVSREELVSALSGSHPDIRPFRNGAIAGFILRNWLADRLD